MLWKVVLQETWGETLSRVSDRLNSKLLVYLVFYIFTPEICEFKFRKK